MAADDDALSLRDARARYFVDNGLPPDGGYQDRWVRASNGRIPIYFLNTKPRQRAVPYHDLHHVLTGYDTTNRGEAEISAWELAAGTWPHWAATGLDLAGVATGLMLSPGRTLRAFARGRRCRSLYREPMTEALLSATVGDVRRRLGISEAAASPSAGDVCAFAALAVASVATLVGMVVLAPVLLLVGPFLS